VSGQRRGHDRERKLVAMLRRDGWVAFRAPASLGCADVIALRGGYAPRLYEVKSTAGGPYKTFGPADRRELHEAATRAGALAFLCWWPPRQREPTFIFSARWPSF
jgi:Holliday junction resolvase